MITRPCLALALSAIVLPLTTLAAESSREFPIGPGGRLVMDAEAGPITVRTWSRPEVRVTVENPDAVTLEYDVSGDTLTVVAEVERPRSLRRLGYFFDVPERFNLELTTAGGSIEVEDMDGSVSAETSGGSIRLGDVSGDADADTAGGSITIGNVGGDVVADTAGGSITVGQVGGDAELDTAGGSIRVDYVMGRVDADTAGGSITLAGAERGVVADTAGGSISVARSGGPVDADTAGGSITLGPVAGTIDASTSGGSIRAELAGAAPGSDMSVELETAGGDLELRLPADHPARVDASIEVSRRARGDYRIYTDFPLAIQGEDDREVTAVGDINGGGDPIRLRTVNGDIHIIRVP